MAKRKEISHESATRRGVTNAKFNEEMSGFLGGEVFFLAVFIGLYFQSWIAFGVSFLGLILALFAKTLANVIITFFSLAWGALGWALGTIFDSIGASITISALTFLGALGANLAALQHYKDIGESEE